MDLPKQTPNGPSLPSGAEAGAGEAPRKVGPALAIGILLMPGIFLWVLLRRGYSAQERMLGFGWGAFLLTMAVLVPKAPLGVKTDAARPVAQAPASAAPSPAPSATPLAAAAPSPARVDPTEADRERERAYLHLLDSSLADVRERGLVYADPSPRISWTSSLMTIGALGTNYSSGLWQTLSPDGEKRKRTWAREAGQMQARAFPRIRALQAKALDQALWELDVRAEALGPASSTLRLTGYHFAANRNIKGVMERIHEDALATRLRRVEFEAYRGGPVTQFDLDPLPDTALATYAFNRWTRVDGN